jgi:hypothetical protein
MYMLHVVDPNGVHVRIRRNQDQDEDKALFPQDCLLASSCMMIRT